MNDDVPKVPEPETEPSVKKYKTITQLEFDQKLKLHQEWLKLDEVERKRQNDKQLILQDYDLSHLTFTEKNLSQVDLQRSCLREVDLSKANLSKANLSSIDFRNGHLIGSNLKEALLAAVDLSGAIVMGADLSKAMLYSSFLEGTFFNGSNLTEAIFTDVKFHPGNKKNKEPSDSSTKGIQPEIQIESQFAQFHNANLTKANFRGVDFKDTDLSNANLRDAVLVKANLKDANTDGTHFGGSNVSNANLPSENYFDDRIDNINESTRMVRTLFITLLGALAFCGLTILSTQDSQLLTLVTSFKLPILGTSVSIKWFYFLAPWFLLGLYVYFHLYFIKHCWLLSKQPRLLPDSSGLGDKILPWMLNSWAIHHFEYPKGEREAIQWSREIFSFWLAWFVTPVCLFFFWGRSFISQNEWLTETHFWVAVISLVLAFGFKMIAKKTLAERGWTFDDRSPLVNYSVAFIILGLVIAIVQFQISQYLVPEYLSKKFKEPNLAYQEVSIKPKNWNPKNPTAGVRGADLSGMDLSNAKASNTFLVGANLKGSRLFEATLNGANLAEAKLKNSDLRDAELKGTVLEGAKLEGADLTNVKYLTCDQIKSALIDEKTVFPFYLVKGETEKQKCNKRTNYQDSDLQGVDFHGVDLTGADFKNADLHNVNFKDFVFQRVNFKKANLQRINFQGANFIDVDFYGAKLKESQLEYSNLVNAKNLTCEQINSASINGETILPVYLKNIWMVSDRSRTCERRTDFQGESLQGVSFQRVDLRGFNFKGANLSEADFKGASLEGVDLTGVNLKGAKGLTPSQIKKAKNWEKALYNIKMEKQLGLFKKPKHLVVNSDIKDDVLQKTVHFSSIPHVGGGDPDVHSKNGRRTQVIVQTGMATIRNKKIIVKVSYSIKELVRNNTLLRKEDEVEIPAPAGYSVEKIKLNRQAQFSYNFPNEDHRWHDISKHPGIKGSHFSSLKIKFDGKGDDDTGNAQLSGTLSIPVTLKKIKK